MKESILFECKRCGKCCREMKGPMMGQLHGLLILPEERPLFPEGLIKPMMRFSPRSRHRAGEIFVYQVDAAPCPHYGDGCLIYERRPLACRAFPFELRTLTKQVCVHESCPEIERLSKTDATVEVPEFYQKAAFAIARWYEVNLRGMDVDLQRFDLQYQRWRGMLEGLTREHMELLKI